MSLRDKICIQKIYNPDGNEALPSDKVLHVDTVKEFIKKLKERLHYRFSGGHSNTADICEDEIDKLTGFALHEKPEVKV